MLMLNRYNFSRPGGQSGVALIMVLAIVAIVSMITFELAVGQQMWSSHSQNVSDRTQADWVDRGAQDYAAMMMDRDRLDGDVDHLNEAWASQLPPFPAEGGMVTVGIEDLQGRFNLNNLVQNGTYNAEAGTVFRRLLTNAQVTNDIQNAIIDWIDTDINPRANGAEDEFYMGRENGYRTPNQPLTNVRELALIKGVDQDTLDKLSGLVTALPQTTKININTAAAPVLASLFEGMPVDEAKSIVDYRERNPFNSPADIMKAVSGSYPAPKETLVSTGSQYFRIATTVDFGRYFQHTDAFLHRPADAKKTFFFYHERPLIRIKKGTESD